MKLPIEIIDKISIFAYGCCFDKSMLHATICRSIVQELRTRVANDDLLSLVRGYSINAVLQRFVENGNNYELDVREIFPDYDGTYGDEICVRLYSIDENIVVVDNASRTYTYTMKNREFKFVLDGKYLLPFRAMYGIGFRIKRISGSGNVYIVFRSIESTISKSNV